MMNGFGQKPLSRALQMILIAAFKTGKFMGSSCHTQDIDRRQKEPKTVRCPSPTSCLTSLEADNMRLSNSSQPPTARKQHRYAEHTLVYISNSGCASSSTALLRTRWCTSVIHRKESDVPGPRVVDTTSGEPTEPPRELAVVLESSTLFCADFGSAGGLIALERRSWMAATTKAARANNRQRYASGWNSDSHECILSTSLSLGPTHAIHSNISGNRSIIAVVDRAS